MAQNDGTGNILIVDDTPDNIDLLGGLLKRYKRTFALNGEKALEKVEKNPPDLILLDVMMPGVDGFEAVEALQADKRTSGIPIAMLTALGDMGSIQRAIDAGATGYLTKPFSVELLHGQVLAIIEKAKEDAGHKLVDYPNVV